MKSSTLAFVTPSFRKFLSCSWSETTKPRPGAWRLGGATAIKDSNKLRSAFLGCASLSTAAPQNGKLWNWKLEIANLKLIEAPTHKENLLAAICSFGFLSSSFDDEACRAGRNCLSLTDLFG